MKWKAQLLLLLSVFLLFLFTTSYNKSDLWVDFDIKIIQNEDARWLGQLYVSENQEYQPFYVKQIHYKNTLNTFQHIRIGIHNINRIQYLRLDPLLNKGIVEIQNMVLLYKGQSYPIDLSHIDPRIQHNIITRHKQSGSILLESTGVDPFIELSHSIVFKTISLNTIIKSIKYIIVFYLFLLGFLQLLKVNLAYEAILFSVLILYSLDTLFLLSPQIAENLLIFFAFVSVSITLHRQPDVFLKYMKNMGWFILFYGLLGYISLYITTDLANPDYFYTKLFYIALALVIPLGFYRLKNFNQQFFKLMMTTLLLGMAVIILLLDHQYIEIHKHVIFDMVMKRTHWTQKNYMFWYVLLFFGTLSFYDIRKKLDFFIILGMVVVSYFVVFGGYSLSARLSYGVGILLFLLLSYIHISKKYLLTIIWIFTFYIIFSPILFALIDFTFLPKLVERDAIYKTSLALIKEHWLFGYGYGSTLSIHIKDFVGTANLPTHYLNAYPGGHPHNLSLLFWIEFGIVGALFLAYYIHKLLKYVIEETYEYTNQAAILSMIVAFDILTSFSWSIWYPQVLLTFAFFGIMLTLSMNICQLRKTY